MIRLTVGVRAGISAKRRFFRCEPSLASTSRRGCPSGKKPSKIPWKKTAEFGTRLQVKDYVGRKSIQLDLSELCSLACSPTHCCVKRFASTKNLPDTKAGGARSYSARSTSGFPPLSSSLIFVYKCLPDSRSRTHIHPHEAEDVARAQRLLTASFY